MRTLTIFAPGLLGPWPQGNGDNLPQPNTPALGRMLARGDRLPLPALGFETALARLFGLEAADLPWGALGLWGEAGQRPEGSVLCLDPVHLKLSMTDGTLFGGPSMRLGMDEAQALANALETHFTERDWRITVAAPERWYLQIPGTTDIHTAPLSRVLRRNAGLFKPQGADASRWLADLTEAQMLLHSHPVNQARDARGLPVINSLWPWGAGTLPVLHKLSADFECVFSNHPLVKGLTHACNMSLHDLPETFHEWLGATDKAAQALIVLDDALQPWMDSDHDDWLATVEGLEARWFAPLWNALARGDVGQVVINDGTGQILYRRAHRWRFWRRSKSLETLCVPTA